MIWFGALQSMRQLFGSGRWLLLENNLFQALCDVTVAAGDVAMGFFQKPMQKWLKNDTSPVSEGDMAVDAFLYEKLRALLPNVDYISEERLKNDLPSGDFFLIDPIDGTRGFLSGSTDWAVAVAYVQNQRPLVSAVYAPAQRRLFAALKGQGAFLNGQRITTSNVSSISGARVSVSPQAARVLRFANETPQIDKRFIASLALRLIEVAEGTVDAALSRGAAKGWDLVAADLLIHEAGGRLGHYQGQGLVYDGSDCRYPPVVAAGEGLYSHLIQRLKDLP